MASDAILACFVILVVAVVAGVLGARLGGRVADDRMRGWLDRLRDEADEPERDIAGTGVVKRDG